MFSKNSAALEKRGCYLYQKFFHLFFFILFFDYKEPGSCSNEENSV